MISSLPVVPVPFRQEAAELLRQLDHELKTLRQDFSVQKAHTLMRLTHTLKGAAATVGLDGIKTTSQSLEYAFKALCVPNTPLTTAVEDLILAGYGCLKRLLSAQLTKADESNILARMDMIVARLQENLGDRFGQDSDLPTSAQLGVDITQSIFEGGVAEYLDELVDALVTPQPEVLGPLLHTHAEVFIGLSESLELPGFGDIARATLAALKHQPDQTVTIAEIALVDYRTAQARVLQGDRAQGGAPSLALQQLGTIPKTVADETAKPTGWNLWRSILSLLPSTKHVVAASPAEPLNTLFQPCRHTLTQLTQQQGKPVVVHIKGGEILVESRLIKHLKEPLLQLVGHVFGQDIETPVVRRQQGKSAVGKIQLAAKQTAHSLIICVWDNGCGVNPHPMRQQVQPAIAALQGTITAVHQLGKGTCFTLKVPREW